MQYLLEADADLEATYLQGWTSLHFATESGYEPMINALLSARSDLEKNNFYQSTALQLVWRERRFRSIN